VILLHRFVATVSIALEPNSPLREAVTALAQPTEGILPVTADPTLAASRRPPTRDGRPVGDIARQAR